jgi:hypothetical protein
MYIPGNWFFDIRVGDQKTGITAKEPFAYLIGPDWRTCLAFIYN